MPVTNNIYIGLTDVGNAPYSAFYNENKDFISSFKQSAGNNYLNKVENAKYVRFSIPNIDIDNFRFKSLNTQYVLNDNNVYEEFMKKEEISYNLKNKQINNTQGSWKPIQLDDNENFIVFIIKGSNYEDCRTIPKELVKKYSASSPLIIKFNNTIIAQLAWNAGNMVEYIWTSGYTIEHYAY